MPHVGPAKKETGSDVRLSRAKQRKLARCSELNAISTSTLSRRTAKKGVGLVRTAGRRRQQVCRHKL